MLSGDEAVARGAWEAGCHVAAAYPGTPSTEILEALATYPEVYSEWSTNEKVALEVALGASICGARAMAAMKHVGLNVAADPLFSAAYVGVRGGLVVISADDPGQHSSQNEQDNRFYGLAAKVPVLCPSDSQECLEFTKLAFDISEEFDIPVIVRLTTRVAHSLSIVELGGRTARPVRGYEKLIAKTLVLPAFARVRHVSLEQRLERLRRYANTTPINRIEPGEDRYGFICDGVSYQYVREVFPRAPVLKLGMVYPFPDDMVMHFAATVGQLAVVEENDPFIELQTRALGIRVIGKDRLPRCGELSPRAVRVALAESPPEIEPEPDLPARPPALCAGCPHIGIFHALQKQKVIVSGDIGCYTLGALPPHNAMDTCIDMGASITVAHGADKALGDSDPRPRVAFIGDSTFFHSGITGLINVAYNRSRVITIISDNRTTGMTGHQDHPGTGRTLSRTETREIDIEAICRACGIETVVTVDPYRVRETRRVVREILEKSGPAVIINRRACALLPREKQPPKQVDTQTCVGCRTCISLGCPAISMKEKKAHIEAAVCIGCGMCADLCPKGAIS
ncbi:MAG: indolepyruvate ferredoxin oxidoreductase subunit alpha [candidate division WOR-3 bacterium]